MAVPTSDLKPRIDRVEPVLMSRDVAASIRFYERLGFVCTFGGPSENPRATPSMTREEA